MYNLKFFLVTLFLAAPFLESRSQYKAGYSIRAEIKGLKNNSCAYLVRNVGLRADTIAKCLVKNNRFEFKGFLSQEGEVHFIQLDSFVSKKAKTLYLDNSSLFLKGNINDWPSKVVVSGNNSTTVFYGLLSILEEPQRQMNAARDSLSKVLKEINDIKKGLIPFYDTVELINKAEMFTRERDQYINKYYNAWVGYLDKHPNSFYTPNSILKLRDYLKPDAIEEAFSKLTPSVQQSFYGRELKQYLEIQRNVRHIYIGADAPDFTSRTVDGKVISLRDFLSRNKLTLIDFWGSWCKPCRQQIPSIKKVYNAFHAKGFNVLGIALESSVEAWKKAIIEEDLPWMNISEIKGRDEMAAKIYDVNGVPAYLLIDSTGRIISIDLPGSKIQSGGEKIRGEALFETVSRILLTQ